VLLGAAAVAKIARPATTARALERVAPFVRRGSGRAFTQAAGLVEFAVAVLAVAWGSRLAAGLLTMAYLVFAAVAARLLAVAAGTDCGCFGQAHSPVRPVHIVGNCVAALIAATGIVWPPGNLAHVLAAQPWAGVPLIGGVALLAWLGYLTFTALPDLLTVAASVE
jgi:hypothetical protein